MRNITAAMLPALPATVAINGETVQAFMHRDETVSALELAQRKLREAQTKLVDLLVADHWHSSDTISPKKQAKEELIERGPFMITRAQAYADIVALATIAVDAKCKADSEEGKDGLKWSKAQKQFHVRTASLSKEDNADLSSEEKAKRKKLRQEIAAYVGNFRRDLQLREDPIGATSGTVKGNKAKAKSKGADSKGPKTSTIIAPQAAIDALVMAILKLEDEDDRVYCISQLSEVASLLGLETGDK